MRKFTSLFISLFFILFIATESWGGKIVYPWRATTAMVMAGESFEVWFVADNGQTVDSVKLIGPHINVTPVSFSATTGSWTYDQWSGNTYNTKITVNVPADAPADRYDLYLKTSTGDEISLAAVRINRQYRDSYYVMHFSDAHRWQSPYDTEGIILKEVSAIIDAANIIDPVVLVETGDFHYPNTARPDISELRIQQFMRGNSSVRGLNNARAPVYLIPGNHDAESKDYNNEINAHGEKEGLRVLATWYNKTYGLTCTNFIYGNTRFIGVNNGWSSRNLGRDPGFVPNYKWQLDSATNWLQEVGPGNLRIAFFHKPQQSASPVFRPFYAINQPISLMMTGHSHTDINNPYALDGVSVDGKEVRITYSTRSPREGNFRAPFNLYKVDNLTGTWQTVGNSRASNEALATTKDYTSDKLTLKISNLTSGHSKTATIKNGFNFEIEGAFARFVMPKGASYIITSGDGYIEQQFEGHSNHIVDVKMNVPANSTKTLTLSPFDLDLCPDDPEKTDPGLCGCGVPEGECAKSSLKVNYGRGDGDYLPLENVAITADNSQFFDKWVVVSGNPYIFDLNLPSTDLRLRGEPAEITATYLPVNNAEFVSQLIPPMTPGEKANVSVTMRNTGTTNWTFNDNYNLGSQNPQNNSTWGFNRVPLNENEAVEPGNIKTFHFEVTAPQNKGTYKFQWRMMREGVEWFGNTSQTQDINIGNSIYIDQCDDLTGWQSSGNLSLNTTDHKQGEGSITFSGSATDEFKKVFANPKSIVGSEADAMLEFWYYISDPSKMTGNNQVELGSSGNPDVDEYNWTLVGLNEGWNYMRLKFSEARKIGKPDLTSINWFRYYSFKSAGITSMIDGIKITGINISVNVSELIGKHIVNVYPNPVNAEGLSVEFALNSISKVDLSILDMNSSVVFRPFSELSFEPGIHKLDIPLHNALPGGVYFMQITINGIKQTRKFLVM
jgi:predicted MPP superfamily phosphohydrolase